MAITKIPIWMENLEDEDISFIKNFVLKSGSLKDIAEVYEVTYPTVRLRLDRLIEKIKIHEKKDDVPYVTMIKQLVLDDKLDYEVAKLLINKYRESENK